MIPFVKLHGLGNHFVLVDAESVFGLELGAWSRRVCDRSRVGADGVLVLSSDRVLRIFNSDGSRAAHCGNGLRCLGRYLQEREPEQAAWKVTLGDDEVSIRADGGLFEVQMEQPLQAGEQDVWEHWTMRNPHAVTWRAGVDLDELRRVSETHDTNAHAAWPEGDRVRVLTWERGAGPTQACGTGATAVAASWFARHPAALSVGVAMPGGLLEVTREWVLRGPAVWIYSGQIED